MSQGEALPVDGRRARRERGRLAVVDATVDLVGEGHQPPGVELIAERAGVSVASVFRYFDNLDDLQDQTTERFFARYAASFEIPDIGVGPLDARIERYVGARLALYDTIAPVARFARSRALHVPRLAENLGLMRRRLATQVRRHFEPELRALPRTARNDVVGSIATLTSFESWDMLRRDLNVGARTVRRAWVGALRALLPG